MINVMFELRSATYPSSEEPVQARLKSLEAMTHDEGPPLITMFPLQHDDVLLGTINPYGLAPQELQQQPQPKKKKKKRRNVEKRKQRKIDRKAAKAAAKAAALAEAAAAAGIENPDAKSTKSAAKPPLPPTPLGLGEEAFPVLKPEPSDKVVERVPEDQDDHGKGRASNNSSDTSSTATASTSSSMLCYHKSILSGTVQTKVGYAAALIKQKQQSNNDTDDDASEHHADDEEPSPVSQDIGNYDDEDQRSSSDQAPVLPTPKNSSCKTGSKSNESSPASVMLQPSGWGGRRGNSSFADVLRTGSKQ